METEHTLLPLTVAIVGSGNVATHLYHAFTSAARSGKDIPGATIDERQCFYLINPRTPENLPEHFDVVIISVKDDAIAEVAEKMKERCTVMAHTSGSVPMTVLGNMAKHTGVFYPLQTFTKGVQLNYSEIPFFIEGDTPETEKILIGLASQISENVSLADSSARKRLHLASVFACNFTNRLIGISREILSESGIDYNVMLPLLKQTLSKLDHLTPEEAQTGPAARKDYKVMQSHLQMLSEQPDIQALYRNMSRQIMDVSCKKSITQ